MDAYWLASFSEWLINLSAGWFAAAFVVPATSKRSSKMNLWILTFNIFSAIVLLFVAVELKRFLGVL